MVDRLVEGLVESQQKIVKLIADNPKISKKAMANVIGISITSVDKSINSLKEKGIIKRVWGDKSGYWELIKGENYQPKSESGLVEGLVDRLVEGLVESQREIVKLIADNPKISKKGMADIIGISTTSIDKSINSLKEKGIIKRIGGDRSGYWELIKGENYQPKSESGLVEGLVDRLVEGLVESQREIVKLIADNPKISKKAMADIIGISTTSIDKSINSLKEKGIIKRVGGDKSGYWELIKGKTYQPESESGLVESQQKS